jgi:serine phosphatase RsbU (regulator of sigma subunit)
MKIRNLIDKCVFEGDKKNPDSYRKGKFFYVSMLILFILLIISIPYYFDSSINFPKTLKIRYALTIVIFLVGLVFYPKFGYRVALANICFGIAFFMNAQTVYQSGGIYSPDNFFNIPLITFIFLVANKSSGYFWAILSVFMFSFFYYAEVNNWQDFKATSNELPVHYNFSSLLFGTLFATIIIHLHENSKDAYLRELQNVKMQVELKNHEITDSINYAKRIQQSKLPTEESIYETLNNSFVLYKPKDIVSGDFYYFKNKNNKVYIAAADCTGHGVPGAFMSLIGHEKIDNLVAENSSVSDILNKLNIEIKTTLKQSDKKDSTKDGMDIALCLINKNNQTVEYAGANRPLWLIRNNSNSVEEIKPTKSAIGGITDDSCHFKKHELQLEKGDSFYIFTDGYPDQFGGMHGKKLMTKNFKEILISIQSKTMQKQKEYLNDYFHEWIVNTEQIDDVLVIGVKL